MSLTAAPTPVGDSRRWRTLELAALATIVALAVILRLYHLGTKSLWLDELNYARTAWGDGTLFGPFGAAIGGHPPAYLFLLRLVMQVGREDWLLRLPAVVASVAGIPALWLLGRSLLGPAVGLLAAFLLAIFPLHVQLAQEVHSYALFGTLSTLALWAVHRAARRELDSETGGSRAWLGAWWPFILVTALNLYSHYYAAFPALLSALLFPLLLADLAAGPAIRLWRLPAARRALIHLAWALGAILLLYLPQLVFGLGASLQHASRRVSAVAASTASLPTPDLASLLAVALDRAGQDALFIAVGFLLILVGLAALAWRLPLAWIQPSAPVARHARGTQWPGEGRPWLALALILWLLLPLPAIAWLNIQIAIAFRLRRLVFALPVALLVVAIALLALAALGVRLWQRIALGTGAGRDGQAPGPVRWIAAGLLVVAITVAAVPALAASYRAPKQDWKTAGAILATHAGTDDVVLAQPGAALNLSWYYDGAIERIEGGLTQVAESLCGPFREVYLVTMLPNEPVPAADAAWWSHHFVRVPLPMLDLYYRNCRPAAWYGDGAGDLFAQARRADLPFPPTEAASLAYERLAAERPSRPIGAAAAQSEDPLGALRALVDAVPDDRGNRMALAAALAEQGLVAEALAEYQAIGERWPDFPWAHIRRGRLLEDSGDLDGAIAAYEEAIRREPGNAFAHVDLGYAYLRADRRADAIRAFEAGLALEPDRPAVRAKLEELRAEGPQP